MFSRARSVQDHRGDWHEAVIVKLELERPRVFVHYTFWTSKWDEWLSVDDDRLQPRGSRICALLEGQRPHALHTPLPCQSVIPGAGPPRLGQLVDAYDAHQTNKAWEDARIVGERPGEVLVRYRRHDASSSAWYPTAGPRTELLQQWGSKTRARQPYKPRTKTYWAGRERGRRFGNDRGQLPATAAKEGSAAEGSVLPSCPLSQQQQPLQAPEARFAFYIAALQRRGLRVVPMGGDGNCLFRSVAHQVR